MTTSTKFNLDIWEKKYRFQDETSPEDTFRRVAGAVATNPEEEEEFFSQMINARFIPGGRILAYAGTNNPKATLANCYVMGDVEDSMEGIMQSLRESALTLKAGGGIGLNFSTLRPEGEMVHGTMSSASGPVSFMEMWNSMSRTISGVNKRKGAMIAILNIDHPDIIKFIQAKANNNPDNPVLEKFNISIGITDDFMNAVINNDTWNLKFNGVVHKTMDAQELMMLIVENAWKKAEPGAIFLDTINRKNNLWYCENISAPNPCGELPLPPFGACMLGAVNLAAFVKDPFGDNPDFDWSTFEKTVQTAVRFLDNTIDVCYFPLEKQREVALSRRRVGLGVMGLGSALSMLKVVYGSEESHRWIDRIFSFLRDTAYLTSVELAKEKGAFPLFDKEKYLNGNFIQSLPEHIRDSIAKYGIRNSHLLTIAPTGSISQFTNYVSSGVEPIFCLQYTRKNPEYNQELLVQEFAWKLYKELKDRDIKDDKTKPEFFITAHELTWKEHLDVMARCQKYIDSAISKTVNLPNSISKDELKDVFIYAWKLGLKGCTIYREGSLDEILKATTEKHAQKTQVNKLPLGKDYKRPYLLPGYTYKVKVPDSKHAYYITFTYEPKSKRPIEMFINTKDPMVSEWTAALGRVLSAIFRNVENPDFVIEDLKDVMGRSGFFSSHRRKFVPSLIAEFGEVVKDFFVEIGLLEAEPPVEIYSDIENELKETDKFNNNGNKQLAYCPHCGNFAGIFEEGCFKCLSCGYNKCG